MGDGTTRTRREDDESAPRQDEESESRQDEDSTDQEQVADAFRSAVAEGEARLSRSWAGLLATGLVGGIDLSTGLLALLIVEHATGSRLLGALAFGMGFVTLVLARSELFTENFLVPVAAVVARQARISGLARLWSGTLVANLLGGWVMAWLIIHALPELRQTARATGETAAAVGTDLPAFALAILGGAVITLMTWVEHNSSTEAGRIVGAAVFGFLLVAGPLNHVVVGSLEMFAALHAGARFGYADWAAVGAWSALGNMAGGMALVTLTRLVQVGAHEIRRHREGVFAK